MPAHVAFRQVDDGNLSSPLRQPKPTRPELVGWSLTYLDKVVKGLLFLVFVRSFGQQRMKLQEFVLHSIGCRAKELLIIFRRSRPSCQQALLDSPLLSLGDALRRHGQSMKAEVKQEQPLLPGC